MSDRLVKASWMDPLKGYTVEWADADKYLLSRGDKLFVADELSTPEQFQPFGQIPAGIGQRLGATTRLGQRLLRYMFYNVICLPESDRVFVTFRDRVGLFNGTGEYMPISGLERPSKFLRGCCAVDGVGGVYLGEYRSNGERQEVKIYHLPKGDDQLHVVHTFAPGEVRHVHGLFYDKYDDLLWCTTGDRESECCIMSSRDGFSTLDVVGGGDETWRAVSLVFDQQGVSYGMDAEFCQNKLFTVDRKSGSRAELGKLPGPVYYARTFGDIHLFGITAEGCPSQPYNAASLWQLKEGSLESVFFYGKDWLPNQFMPGTLHFNLGPGRSDDECFCYMNGLHGVDGRTVKLSRSNALT